MSSTCAERADRTFSGSALWTVGCAAVSLAGACVLWLAAPRALGAGWAAAGQAAKLVAEAADTVPGEVQVPALLLSRTSMPEVSALLWSEALGRYLVLSDDTGDKQQGTAHAPWLFTMSRDGVMDSEPLVIDGIEQLNDGEALAAGPDGTFFLATSRSRDKKGRVKDARRRLLQLRLGPAAQRRAQLVGSIDLQALHEDGRVAPAGQVDIEALAYRGGDLYLGLKAPLTAAGAQIVRLRDARRALAEGRVAAEQVAPFAVVPLQVPALAVDGSAGAPVAQGISDMLFLPDGSLVLLANSPKRLPPDGGGALWWLPASKDKGLGGLAGPRLLRRFPGLKPEAVALAPGGGLAIGFDCDRRTPLWLLQPRPR